jgi:hypothetical protein
VTQIPGRSAHSGLGSGVPSLSAPAVSPGFWSSAKRPFGLPQHVLKHLARYTHRFAISNHRITHVGDGKVAFRWKDYAHEDKQKLMTVTAEEFLRRFLLHTLPRGFVRIRSWGFLANRRRGACLSLCQALLRTKPPVSLIGTTAVVSRSGFFLAMAVRWLLSKGSPPHRSVGDPSAGRACVTALSGRSSTDSWLASARKPNVCLDPITEAKNGPKTLPNSVRCRSLIASRRNLAHFNAATTLQNHSLETSQTIEHP